MKALLCVLFLIFVLPFVDIWWHGTITGFALLGAAMVTLIAVWQMTRKRKRHLKSLRRELEQSNVHFYL